MRVDRTLGGEAWPAKDGRPRHRAVTPFPSREGSLCVPPDSTTGAREGSLIAPCYPYMQRKGKEKLGLESRAKVTSKGQVTIPADIRRALRVRKGDVVVFEVDAGGVRLRPLREGADVFAEYEGAWREGEGETVEEINAWLRELRGHEG